MRRNTAELGQVGKKKRISLLLQLISSFLIPVTLIILVITVLFTSLLLNELEKDINTNSFLTLSNLHVSLDSFIDDATLTTYEIFNNISIKELLYARTKNPGEVNQARIYLNNLLRSNNNLYSIYVISGNEIRLNMGGGEFFRIGLDELDRLIRKSSAFLLPIPYQVKNQYGLMNLIAFHLSTGQPGITDAPQVVVFFNGHRIFPFIDDLKLKEKQQLMVLDRQGHIISHTDTAAFSTVFQSDAVARIQRSPERSGILQYNSENTNRIVHYQKSKNDLFSILLFSDKREFFQRTLSIRDRIIAISVAVMLLLILWVLYLSKKIYGPINIFYTNMRLLLKTGTSSELFRESEDMTSSLARMIRRMNDLEQDLRDTNDRQGNVFIQEMLHSSTTITDEDFSEKIHLLGLDTINSGWIVLCLRIDNYSVFIEKNSRSAILLHLTTIEEITNKLLSSAGRRVIPFSPEYDKLFFILSSEEQDSTLEELISIVQMIRQRVSSVLAVSFTAGFSEPRAVFSRRTLHMSLNESLLMTDCRVIHGIGGTFGFSSSKDNAEIDLKLLTCSIKKILETVRLGREDLFAQRYSAFSHRLSRMDYPAFLDSMVKLAIGMINLLEMYPKASLAEKPYTIDNINATFRNFENLDQYRAWFESRYSQISSVMHSQNRPRTNELCDMAIRYIRKRFSDPLLSASRIAEYLEISPQYFSKIFQRHTGTSFPNFMNELRLDNARKILADNPNKPIKEIARSVGFTNNSYFASSFKGRFGCTPSKYQSSEDLRTPLDSGAS